MRIRLEYKKINSLTFLSILDMIRLWERILRRSELPLKYSQGFNPKPILDFSLAIPLGIESESEIVDFYLEKDLEIDFILKSLNKVKPIDLIIKRGKMVDENSKPLSLLITHIEIEILGKEVKDLNFKSLEIIKNGKKIELNDHIFKEEYYDLKKILIFDRFISIKDIIKKLRELPFDYKIIKKNNYNLDFDKLINVFDLN